MSSVCPACPIPLSFLKISPFRPWVSSMLIKFLLWITGVQNFGIALFTRNQKKSPFRSPWVMVVMVSRAHDGISAATLLNRRMYARNQSSSVYFTSNKLKVVFLYFLLLLKWWEGYILEILTRMDCLKFMFLKPVLGWVYQRGHKSFALNLFS